MVRSVDAGERWRQLTFVVFDVPYLDAPFEDRMAAALDWWSKANPPHAQIHRQETLQDLKDLFDRLDQLVAEGAEGLMIREPGSQYEKGRSSTLLKVKPWTDGEATVVGYEAGKGKHKGKTGGLVVRTDDGIEFNIGTGLTDGARRNPPKIGARITYKFTGDKTEDGVPKGASFVCERNYE